MELPIGVEHKQCARAGHQNQAKGESRAGRVCIGGSEAYQQLEVQRDAIAKLGDAGCRRAAQRRPASVDDLTVKVFLGLCSQTRIMQGHTGSTQCTLVNPRPNLCRQDAATLCLRTLATLGLRHSCGACIHESDASLSDSSWSVSSTSSNQSPPVTASGSLSSPHP